MAENIGVNRKPADTRQAEQQTRAVLENEFQPVLPTHTAMQKRGWSFPTAQGRNRRVPRVYAPAIHS